MTRLRASTPLSTIAAMCAASTEAWVMSRTPASCIAASLPENDSCRLVRKNAGHTTETSIDHGASSKDNVSLRATTPALVAL